jgi:hypothetical protein
MELPFSVQLHNGFGQVRGPQVHHTAKGGIDGSISAFAATCQKGQHQDDQHRKYRAPDRQSSPRILCVRMHMVLSEQFSSRIFAPAKRFSSNLGEIVFAMAGWRAA